MSLCRSSSCHYCLALLSRQRHTVGTIEKSRDPRSANKNGSKSLHILSSLVHRSFGSWTSNLDSGDAALFSFAMYVFFLSLTKKTGFWIGSGCQCVLKISQSNPIPYRDCWLWRILFFPSPPPHFAEGIIIIGLQFTGR